MARIVIADDDADIREMVVFKLRHGGHDVVPCADGAAALRACGGGVDLVILDVMMPGVGGFDVAESLRDQPATADVPIMMLTARSMDADIERGAAVGVADYVIKPFSPRELLQRVTQVLERAGNRSAR